MVSPTTCSANPKFENPRKELIEPPVKKMCQFLYIYFIYTQKYIILNICVPPDCYHKPLETFGGFNRGRLLQLPQLTVKVVCQ